MTLLPKGVWGVELVTIHAERQYHRGDPQQRPISHMRGIDGNMFLAEHGPSTKGKLHDDNHQEKDGRLN